MRKRVVGIQGAKGSFNEEAFLKYADENGIRNFEIKYLHTTKKVLEALRNKEVRLGQFAIYNSIAGEVEETEEVISDYHFRIVETIELPIRHYLMKKKGVPVLKKIMAHPQVFKQCKNNLQKKYPNLERVSGGGDLIDTARIAELIVKGVLDKTTGVLGPKVLTEIYDELEIADSDLQDSKDNVTTFLLVKM